MHNKPCVILSLLSIILSLALLSCDKESSEMQGYLSYAEKLLDTNPEAAYHLLKDSIGEDVFKNETDEESAIYALRLAQAIHKTGKGGPKELLMNDAKAYTKVCSPNAHTVEISLALSEIYRSEDRLSNALYSALRAYIAAVELSDLSLEAYCHEELATIYLLSGHSNEAHKSLFQAWSIHSILGHDSAAERCSARLDSVHTAPDHDIYLYDEITETENRFYQDIADEAKLREENNQRKLSITIALSIILVIIVSLIFAYLIQRKKALINRKMSEIVLLTNNIEQLVTLASSQKETIDSLTSDLNTTQSKTEEMRLKLALLLRGRFTHLNTIINEYAGQLDSRENYLAFFKNIEHEVNKITHPKSIAEIERLVNECKNNIIAAMRLQLPTLKERDLIFIVLTLAGFNARSIALILDIHVNSTYKKKKQLISSIANSTAPDREWFISELRSN
ncbi:hypothetical protein [Duncaniella sp.]|uniref:hypothetical protein n=1 Tax=Duncaniella sp. TaxID=2518496 RepID=UPI0023C3EF8A|nr:hypothetical protein [Duncaniella sp.]MDE5904941.1 hypothetical protein [Duncaniella sp.]